MKNWFIGGKWIWLSLLITTAIWGGVNIGKLKIDSSIEVWFLKDSPSLINYQEFKEDYGNDEIVVAWIKPSQKSIYKIDFVKKLQEISQNLKSHDLVERVFSLTSSSYIGDDDGDLVVENIVPSDASFSEKEIEERFLSNPMWAQLLRNKDSTATILLIEPVTTPNMDAKRGEVLDFIHTTLSGTNYKLTGGGVIYEELNRLGMKDFSTFAALSYIILIVSLFVLLKSFRVLLTASITIVISICIFLGIFVAVGQKLDSISIMLPTLIIIICIADIVHIFTYYQKLDIANHNERLQSTFSHVTLPCFLTTATTVLGFLSFFSSPMAILKNFGIFAAIGVTIAFVVSFVISVITLSLFPAKAKPKSSWFERPLHKLTQFNYAYRKKIIALGSVLVAIMTLGIFYLNADTYSLNFLLDSNQVKKDAYFIENNYGHYLPLEFRILAKEGSSIKNPEFLKKIEAVYQELSTVDYLQKPTSLVDIIKQLNKVLTDNQSESYVIAKTKQAVAQELFFYEMDVDNQMSYFTNFERSELRFTVRIKMESSRTIQKHLTQTKNIMLKYFSAEQIVACGYAPLYVTMMDYIVSSQTSSFLIAFAVILIVLGVLYRSLAMTLIAIVPNILPILLTLGFMGWTGIPLDVATVTIASIVISISVDDTIHFMFVYRSSMQKFSSKESIEQTMRVAGEAITVTSILLVVGYIVFCLASMKSVILFGLLVAVSMIFALLCDLILLPALILTVWKDNENES
ncbi:RND family transporter [Candidatus Uabimicrobium sp. HlEnr_7]|uniref:efflux RND transporter permease subunit n=1 Tax=Candidatus Uabimicrobium helgolandensis TaxID=3095367 RepID=UPI0035583745